MIRLLLAFLAVVLLQGLPATAGTITHALGTTEVPAAPQRIVVLEYSFVDAMAALGVTPVGIADDRRGADILTDYSGILGADWTSVGTRKTPSLEVIAALQPDLIIADTSRHAAVYDTLSEIAPTIVLDSLTGDYDQTLEQAQIIGDALGRSDAMAQRIQQHEARIAALKEKFGNRSESVSIQFGVANATGLWLHGPGSYIGSFVQALGFSSTMPRSTDMTYDTYDGIYVPTTLEELSSLDPDLLILGKYVDPAITDRWSVDHLFQSLRAVRSGRVFEVDAHRWSRLRGILAAEQIAAALEGILDRAL